MFTHLLVPLDGSTLAEAVLADAQFLAARLNARLTLLHITEKNPPATIHGDRHLTATGEAEAYLRELAGRWPLPARATAWHVHEAGDQGVAAMIVDQALELGADLIVLSTHGSGVVLREKLLGSIAQHVVREGRVPVLLSRARKNGAAPRALAQIVLPLDGEAVHETAVPVAAALARAFGAAIHLIAVVPTSETLSGPEASTGAIMPNAMRAMLEFAQQGSADYLQKVRATLPASATIEVARGDPAKGIIAAAERVHADLIVMATHGRMGLNAFWSASIAPKVLTGYAGSLLLLRAPDA
ncbi:MAG: universal stress protein [Chloroflexi bacterium]|nr:universal stress protein [Chloroflexota bacterium]